MKVEIKATDDLLNQVIMSLTDKDIEQMVKYEAVCDGPPSNCVGPRPRPLRMIAYDDMVNGVA